MSTIGDTIGDESTEVLHAEQSTQHDSESKSYYVSSIHRINDLEKTQVWSLLILCKPFLDVFTIKH